MGRVALQLPVCPVTAALPVTIASARGDPEGDAPARDKLIESGLSPPPLYPSRLPARLRDASTRAEVSKRRYYVAYFSRHPRNGSDGGTFSIARHTISAMEDDAATVTAVHEVRTPADES